jgi:beta-galactosidase GanA
LGLTFSQVTYDEHSLLVYGERVFVFSGEFHAYRLPVPGLWLDIFQKVKALGFNAVSFYTHWALLEGEPGVYNASGVFALEPFFEAASTAGIYLIARPGPVSICFRYLMSSRLTIVL